MWDTFLNHPVLDMLHIEKLKSGTKLPKSTVPDLANCSDRNAAVDRRPRGRSAWPGRAAQVALDELFIDMIIHAWAEWPDTLRLRTVIRDHWACDITH